MISNKKLKTKALPFALVGVMGLSGCVLNKNDKNTQETHGNTDAKVENTTVQTTLENTTEVEVVTTEEVKEDFYSKAAKTYNEYTDFYSYTGLAYADENGNVNIERIENAIKTINGEVADLTPSQVVDAKEDINYILLSQDLVSNLNDIYNAELGYVKIEGQISMLETPKLAEFATNKETKEIVEKYEMLRDKVQNDLNTNNKVSNETKEELKKAVVDMEKEYLPDKNNMNSDVNAEGNKLLENLAKEALVELTVLATNETRIYSEEFPDGLKLTAETDEERDIESKALIHGLEILTDSEKEIYANMTMELIVTKYEEGVCAHLQNLADHAKDNSNVHSKEDTNEKIAKLMSIKNELEAMKFSMNNTDYELTFNL